MMPNRFDRSETRCAAISSSVFMPWTPLEIVRHTRGIRVINRGEESPSQACAASEFPTEPFRHEARTEITANGLHALITGAKVSSDDIETKSGLPEPA